MATIGAVLSGFGLLVGIATLWKSFREKQEKERLERPPVQPRQALQGVIDQLAKELMTDQLKEPDIRSIVARAIDELQAEIQDQLEDRLSYTPKPEVVEQTAVHVLDRTRGNVRAQLLPRIADAPAVAGKSLINHLLEDEKIRGAVTRAIKRTVDSLSSRRIFVLRTTAITFLVPSFLVLVVSLHHWLDRQPVHARLADGALKAFEEEDWDEAKVLAEKCVKGFESAARTTRDKLDKIGYQLPKSQDWTDEEKEQVFKNGPLNDVAASHWVLGCIYQEQGNVDKAREEYTKAAMYPRSAKWDPRGWFFFPGLDAAARLELLDEKASDTPPDAMPGVDPSSDGP